MRWFLLVFCIGPESGHFARESGEDETERESERERERERDREVMRAVSSCCVYEEAGAKQQCHMEHPRVRSGGGGGGKENI